MKDDNNKRNIHKVNNTDNVFLNTTSKCCADLFISTKSQGSPDNGVSYKDLRPGFTRM